MNWNIISISLLIFTLIGCSKQVDHMVKPGESTITEMIDELGNPNVINLSSFGPNDEMFHWDELTLQVEKKLVKASFRQPEADEIYLQYWRQKFKHSESSFEPVRSPASTQLWQLNFPSEGYTVIYNKNISKVIKVIKHVSRY